MSGYDTDYGDVDEYADGGYADGDYVDDGYGGVGGDAAGRPDATEPVDAEGLLRRAIEVVSGAKAMPLSSSVLISREEVLELLEDAVQRFPDELRQARWLLREREDFLRRTRSEAEEILNAARARATHMVERTEIVRQAQATARRTIEDANQEASQLRHEAEDFCDQKLAAFEIVLDRTTKMVNAGREKLRVTPAPLDSGLGERESYDDYGAGGGYGPQAGVDEAGRGEVFFDQDQL